ncbi:IS110 family RNA-guided transposase [Burkholderia multivorans]|uniref:IS110 family transposase n=1 Tax=Burkholderia multivorans TaxID=87883 RepID=UPI0021577E3E|nr:IS110 family transposase [Burkholderia multivorans]
MNATTYGLDVAKHVFQMYWVDVQTGEIANRRFRRDELIAFLAQRPAGRVALEACGSAHWWARKIKALGHEVVLLHAKFIRPFVQTNKTDAADARAIWTAVQQPGMRTVAAKTEDQQAMLGLHRMRSLLIKFRTMQVNQLRGLLYEFGVSFRAGRAAGLAEMRARMAELEDALPGVQKHVMMQTEEARDTQRRAEAALAKVQQRNEQLVGDVQRMTAEADEHRRWGERHEKQLASVMEDARALRRERDGFAQQAALLQGQLTARAEPAPERAMKRARVSRR